MKNLGDIVQALFVGPGGSYMTPEELAKRRTLLQQQSGKYDTSPVQHWSQGATRIVESLNNILRERNLDREAEALAEEDKAAMSALMGAIPGAGGADVGAAVPSPDVGAVPQAESPPDGAPAPAGPAPSFVRAQPIGPSGGFSAVFSDTEKKYNLPPGYLARVAQIESGMRPDAANPKSSARGLFQFMPGTAQQYGLKNRFDPIASTDAAGRVAVDSASILRRSLGREPTAAELYLAHQQGAGGASKLLSNPNAPAAKVVGIDAVRLNGGKADMTAQQFANLWMNRFNADPQSKRQRGGGPVSPAVAQAVASGDPQATAQAAPVATALAAQGGVPPQRLLEIAANPRLRSTTRDIAKSLLNNQMQQAAAAAERARTVAERQQIAPILGIDPRLAVNGDAWKAAVSESYKMHTVGPNQTMVRGGQVIGQTGPAPTTDIQNYEYAAEQARAAGQTPPTFEQWRAGNQQDPAKVQQIQRLAETLVADGTVADPQVARNVAVAIADGRFVVSRNEMTGKAEIIDKATGQPVIMGQPQQPAQVIPNQAAPEVQGATPAQPGQSVPRFAGAPESFGVTGAIRGRVNTLADVAGLPPVWPETQRTQANLDVLGERILSDLRRGYGGQVPKSVIDNLYKLIPRAGSVTQGPSGAQTRLRAIRDEYSSSAESIRKQLSDRSLLPATRQDLESRLVGFVDALSKVDEALAGFGGGQQRPPPQPGETVNGYRFKGGDPRDRNNWERLNG